MNKKKRPHPHDIFFKDGFSRLSVARSFVSEYLGPLDRGNIDLDTLESVQDDHTTPELVEFFSDSVYTALTPNGTRRVYIILEHKSYIDHKVGMQILANIVMLHQYHKRQHGCGGRSPIILAVLIYHGKAKWRSGSHPLINFALPQDLKTFSPDLRFTFCDLSLTPKDTIRGIYLLKILFLSFKYICHADLITILPEILVMFREHEDEPDVQEFFRAFLTYIGNAAPRDKIVEIRRVVDGFLTKGGNEMPDLLKEIANDLLQKKIAKVKAEAKAEAEAKVKADVEAKIRADVEGKEKAKVKAEVSRKVLDIARTMIGKGFNTATISGITGLSPGAINKLRK